MCYSAKKNCILVVLLFEFFLVQPFDYRGCFVYFAMAMAASWSLSAHSRYILDSKMAASTIWQSKQYNELRACE